MNEVLLKKLRKNANKTNEKLFFNILCFVYMKMANKYYQKHKEKLRKEARERYQNLSEKKRKKGKKKACDRYRNFLDEEKEKKHQCYR